MTNKNHMVASSYLKELSPLKYYFISQVSLVASSSAKL